MHCLFIEHLLSTQPSGKVPRGEENAMLILLAILLGEQ